MEILELYKESNQYMVISIRDWICRKAKRDFGEDLQLPYNIVQWKGNAHYSLEPVSLKELLEWSWR